MNLCSFKFVQRKTVDCEYLSTSVLISNQLSSISLSFVITRCQIFQHRLHQIRFWNPPPLSPVTKCQLCQLLLSAVSKQYKFVTSFSWEGNRRSGVALGMRHSQCGITTYGLTAYRKGDEHPAYTPYIHTNDL